MASLSVQYVKSRQECKDCQRKGTGLIGIAAMCLGIEVHTGATHKFYHPKCFFEGSKCRDVIDKLPYKTAIGMSGYNTLSDSDQMMIYSLFANATTDDDDSEEEETVRKTVRKVATKRVKKHEHKETKDKQPKKEENEETPKKRRRTERAKRGSKEYEEAQEFATEISNASKGMSQKKKEKAISKNSSSKKVLPSEDDLDLINSDFDEVELPRKENKSNVQAQISPHKKEVLLRDRKVKVEGRGKPSEKMAAIYEKIFKRKMDEQVDLDLDSESDEE